MLLSVLYFQSVLHSHGINIMAEKIKLDNAVYSIWICEGTVLQLATELILGTYTF